MTLSSRQRIRNSSPGGLRPSTLPLGHGGSPQYWLSHVDGEETFFVSFKPPRPGTEPRTLAWKAAVLTTTLGPSPSRFINGLTLIPLDQHMLEQVLTHRSLETFGDFLKSRHWKWSNNHNFFCHLKCQINKNTINNSVNKKMCSECARKSSFFYWPFDWKSGQ